MLNLLLTYLVVFAARFISWADYAGNITLFDVQAIVDSVWYHAVVIHLPAVIALNDVWHAVTFEVESLSYTTGGLYVCLEGDLVARCVGILAAQ